QGRAAARAAVAEALAEAGEGRARVHVPVVGDSHVGVEVHRALQPDPGGVPGLPVVAVDLEPAVDAALVAEAERGPGAPVEDVHAAEVAQVVDLEAGRLAHETG